MEPTPPADRDFAELASELETRLSAWRGGAWPNGDFERLAARVFVWQHGAGGPYRALCDRRGVTPGTLATWEDVPMVPATAFKHVDLYTAPGAPERVFLTSGTTAGTGTRGRHPVARASLYRASLLEPFRRALLPDATGVRVLSLVPPADEAPDSSLSFMVTEAADALATEAVWAVRGDGGLDERAARACLATSADVDEPLLVVGTALALLNLVERLGSTPPPPAAEGSRLMETGGLKGSGRSIERVALHARVAGATGVPEARIVGEYGMTELLSQLYEPVLLEGVGARGLYAPPPWLRVRALDPGSLEPVPEGEDGILAFFDLANLGSVSHVLTEDVGALEDGRVRLRGRRPGAEPRGCSRAMDELMQAAAARSSGGPPGRAR